MTDKEWFRRRKIEKLEKYLCLFVVLLMLYGLLFNWLFLIRFFGMVILVSIIVSIQELILLLKERKDKKDS
ncbi:hypothetical protein [Enterococcus sp. DIV1420a]|uniref:hypothetical protein n=1 Tax=Enterococcus TaxID=1350 RepID=UPI003F267666